MRKFWGRKRVKLVRLMRMSLLRTHKTMEGLLSLRMRFTLLQIHDHNLMVITARFFPGIFIHFT